ncbi:MAG: YjbQ family protein [Acidimicrobiia bacterium]|nr:YjbQ family protein [Acidimicrobiia bacterium]
MRTAEITIETDRHAAAVDLTSDAVDFCRDQGDGLLSVYVPHATAGLAIFETGAGSDRDVLSSIDELWPRDRSRWSHEHGTPGHGRDHVLPAFIAPSITIPVVGGAMQLGTWQSLVLIDTNVDNPIRKVRFSFLPG